MSSVTTILPDFEYDIFISYRHNDNRSGWVREFVHHLSEELAATLKDPVSIYFDENPNDGLLETDVVNDSLKDKLNCLIFIPIISQTYCDPKSFAWQSEFLVFKKLASEGDPGLKIKLSNGNTTSRILSVRIHDIDDDDQAVIENETGPLRSIDFIFKSPGVNRPLSPSDNPDQNQNKTLYRNQVNKVANCIKEIVVSLKNQTNSTTRSKRGDQRQIERRIPIKKLALAGGTIIALLIISFFVFFLSKPTPEPLEKSIAVLPFDDLSENHDQEYFSDGISEEIINALVKIQGLKVPGRTSSFQFKGKNIDLKEIGSKLNVSLILEGSVRKSGNHLRITAQLIDARNGYHLWSETYEHDLKDIFIAQDEVTKGIVNQLQQRLGVQGTLTERKLPTQSLEAYDLYLKGHQQFLLKGEHVYKAQELLKEAIRLDPTFAVGHAALAEAYAVNDMGFGNPKEAVASAQRALAIDSTLSSAYAVIAWIHSTGSNSAVPQSVEYGDLIHSNFDRAIKLDPQNSTAHLWFGISLMHFGLFEQTITHLRDAVEIDPLVGVNYGMLGFAEYLYGQDSIGYLHLQEGIKLGWAAGNQRLAFYYLDHQEWDKAEYYFKEHAALVPMSTSLDYHQLVIAIKQKDVQTARRILDSFTNMKGFTAGFKPRIYYLTGDYERAIAYLDDWGVTEAMRPSRRELRQQSEFRPFVEASGLAKYWKKYGWPDVCNPAGEYGFTCD